VDQTDPSANTYAVWTLPLDGSPVQRMTSPPAGHIDLAPAYSPDAKTLAFIRRGGEHSDIYLQQKPGEERRLTFEGTQMDSLAWAADGRSIVFSSQRPAGRALWRVQAAGGAPERVADVGADATHVAIARQGYQLVYVRNTAERSDILKLETASTRP